MKSLKLAIIRYSMVSVGFVLLLILAIFFGQRTLSRSEYRERIAVELVTSSENLVQKIAGSLLLPEEKDSIPLFMQEVKKSEGLSSAGLRLFTDPSEFAGDRGCRAVSSLSYVCGSLWSDQVQVLTVIRAGNRTIGVLEKAKDVPAAVSWTRGYRYLLVMVGGLLLALGLILFRTFQFLKTDVYDPLKSVLTLSKVSVDADGSAEFREELFRHIKFKEINRLASTILDLQQQVARQVSHQKAADMSARVAHDLRSPLSLLKVLMGRSADTLTEEEVQLGRTAVQRIEDITEDLLRQKRAANARQAEAKSDEVFVSDVLRGMREVVDECQAAAPAGDGVHGAVNIRVQPFLSEAGMDRKVKIKLPDLQRSTANLLRNSIEAGATWIRIQYLMDSQGFLQIHILDAGQGLSSGRLATVRRYFRSVGKANGHGLGLSGAAHMVKKAAGQFEIQSVAGAGTLISMRLPTFI